MQSPDVKAVGAYNYHCVLNSSKYVIMALYRVYLLSFPRERQLYRTESLHQSELSVRAVVLMAPIKNMLLNSSFLFFVPSSPFHFPSQRQI
jgi:hypothetical protein